MFCYVHVLYNKTYFPLKLKVINKVSDSWYLFETFDLILYEHFKVKYKY